MNLSAYIARCGFCSRRKAGVLIKEGKVRVNGVITIQPWRRVGDGDAVVVNGAPLAAERYTYLMYNKPYGVTATVDDKFAAKKIVDMVPKDLGRLYPVGRLDRMSRGLIILTNDGDLCNKLTHPRFEVEKEYVVTVKGRVDASIIKKLTDGVEEGPDFLSVKNAAIKSTDDKRSTFQVIVCEGKKRHIRRLFSKLGHSILDLRRVRIGGLQLGDLKEGAYKALDARTIYRKTLGI